MCYRGVKRKLRGVTGIFQGHFSRITGLLQSLSCVVLGMLQWCYRDICKIVTGKGVRGVAGLLHRYYSSGT